MYPKPVIEKIGEILVVRDDLIPGGTKVRALEPFIKPGKEYVYASPASGFAQIALAISAQRAGARSTIFVAQRKELHLRTAQAQEAGAQIKQIPYGYLSNVKAKARAYAEEAGATLLPFGLDFPEFISELASIARGLGISPREVWCVAGSGVLTRALQQAWPKARHNAVKIGAEPIAGRAEILTAPEKFEQDAKDPPPFPSCSNYDAKAWQYIKRSAGSGSLFWNVAG